MMTDEEIKAQAKKFRRNSGMLSFVRGAEWAKEQAEKECPTLKQIIRVLEIYDNAFKGFSEDAKRETAGYIEEKWKD